MGTNTPPQERLEDPRYFQGASIPEIDYILPCPGCGKDVPWTYTPTGVKGIDCDC